MIVLYGVTCAVSFMLIVAYCGLFIKKDVWFLMTFIAVFICNTGYLGVAASRTVEEALLANRIAYLGSVFLPFFLLMTIMRVCKCRYPRILPFVLILINTAMLLLTISAGYSDVYYKEVSFEIVNGIGKLNREYGVLHNIYYVYLVSYFCALIGVICRSFFRKKLVSYKHAYFLAIAVLINIAIYFIERIIDHDLEVLSLSYILTEIFLLFIYKTLEDYDIDSILESTLATDRTGVILFDTNNNFKGCNYDAAAVFPELSELRLEYPVPPSEGTLQSTVIPVLMKSYSNNNVTYTRGDKIYRLIAKPFCRKGSMRGKLLGTAVLINDETAQQEYFLLLSSYNEKLEEEVTKKTEHVLAMHDGLIISMANMVEGRDPNTGGHIKRTSSVVSIFVSKLKEIGYGDFSESFLKNVAKAAPMHDLGKIAIDDAILKKPGRYTPEEYCVMQTHSAKGADIVGRILRREDDVEFYGIAVNVAHYHHEKYDGTGYPERLRGEEIPIEARIMALADVFDALVSKRCYKEKYSYEQAFGIIRDSLGGQFDPKLGTIFLSCADELVACYEALKDID